MDDKGRTKVGLFDPKKRYYPLLTQVPGKSGEYRVNPQLPKEVLRALGESRRQTIQEEIGSLSEDIIENKKKLQKTHQKVKQRGIRPVKGRKGKFQNEQIYKDNWFN